MGRRFPFPIPFGWFQVAFPDDLAPGEVTRAALLEHATSCSGATTAGDFHLQDAYCPHLGAHLGVGGKVDGDEVVCPFHGWKYDGDGRVHEHPVQPARQQEGEAAHVPDDRAQRVRARLVPPARRTRRSGRSR